MSEIKVNSIKGVGASTAAITVNNTDGTCTANITNNLSNRNALINGAMVIHQRGGNTTGINDTQNYYVADRWRYNHGANGTVTVSHETDSPDGFSNSIKVAVTTAGTSSNPAQFYQKIEGHNLQHFAKGTSGAKKFAISFFIKSKVTGNFVLDLYDSNNARSCQQIYTVSQSETWERKTVVIPADTTGVFSNDNGSSLQIYWKVFDGDQTGTLHTTWQAHTTNADRGVGQVNALATDGDFVQITGCQLEASEVATDFEHRSFGQELSLCQRYYYKHAEGDNKDVGVGTYYTSSLFAFSIKFPVSMRAAPSLDYVSGTNYYTIFHSNTNDKFTAFAITRNQENCAAFDTSTDTSGVQGAGGIVATVNNSSYIALSAEL